MGGKRVAQSVNGHRFGNACQRYRLLQRALHTVFVEMVTPLHAAARIDGQGG
jgi:hypothetical protein